MNIIWVSRKGGRTKNEDCLGKIRRKGITCIVVADGLGGHNAGDVASHCLVETVLNDFDKSPEFSRDALVKYVSNAHDVLIQKSMTDPKYLKMASTAVLLLIRGKKAIWANVGDSRLYRFENSRIIEVTEDHSAAFEEFKAGKIEYDDIRRSKNQNSLTNAVGSHIQGLKIYGPRHIGSHPSFLLCTDGFWEYVDEENMESTREQSVNIRNWLESMVDIRDRKAPENSDNYSAVVVCA